MKKLIAVLITVFLLIGLFASCGSKGITEQVEGVLQSYSGNLITINSTSGETLVFSIDNAKITSTHGLIAGDDLMIVFDGTISGADTTQATVTEVRDLSTGSSDLSETVMKGTIADASMNTLSVTSDDDGNTYTFVTTFAEVDVKSSLEIGNTVYVTYTGTLVNGDASNVNVIKVVDNDENVEPTPAIVQTITDTDDQVWVTENNVNVFTGPGTTYTRLGGRGVNDELHRTGVTNDGWSRIKWGEMDGYVATKYLTTTKPAGAAAAPVPSPAPETYNKISGHVQDIGKDTVTIARKDGVYKFVIKGAHLSYKNGIQVGNLITIEYSGTLNGTDTSGVKVHKVIDKDANEPDPGVIVTGPGPATKPTDSAPATTTESGPAETPAPTESTPKPTAVDPPVQTAPEPVETPPVETAPEPVEAAPPVETAPGPVETPPEEPVHASPALFGGGGVPITHKTIFGTITGTSGNTVTIVTDDNATLTFEVTDDTSISFTDDDGNEITSLDGLKNDMVIGIVPGSNDPNSNVKIAKAIGRDMRGK